MDRVLAVDLVQEGMIYFSFFEVSTELFVVLSSDRETRMELPESLTIEYETIKHWIWKGIKKSDYVKFSG